VDGLTRPHGCHTCGSANDTKENIGVDADQSQRAVHPRDTSFAIICQINTFDVYELHHTSGSQSLTARTIAETSGARFWMAVAEYECMSVGDESKRPLRIITQ